jgi:diguanylate cyclase (GGDEF)-like protein
MGLAPRESVSGRHHGSLSLYPLLARIPWPASFAGRLAVVAMLTANLPAMLFAGIALWRLDPAPDEAALVFAGVLLAVPAAAVLTQACLRRALAPMLVSAEALRAYAERQQVPKLPTGYSDEAGWLMREVQHTVASFQMTQAELRIRAETDPLTGIMNRRSFFTRAAEEIARARRTGDPLALVLFDVDHFKSVNDSFGHAAGDAVLRLLTASVQRHLRIYDRFARLGGEEFAILVPGIAFEDALGVSERMRLQITKLALPAIAGCTVTASFGVTPLIQGDATIDDMLARADLALYEAKDNGRNRVVWRNPEQPSRCLPDTLPFLPRIPAGQQRQPRLGIRLGSGLLAVGSHRLHVLGTRHGNHVIAGIHEVDLAGDAR